ncbi:MAG: tripartite tricarboxylate transporter TctB family protein, partial [Chloroflexota bacterium]
LVHPSSSAETSKFVEEEGAEAGHAASASCGIATVAVMAAYIFALPYVGFFIGTTVFAVSLMRLGGSRSVMRDIAVALVTTLVIQMAFTLVLLVPLPSGYWLEW